MNVAYECKFCQKPGVVTLEEPVEFVAIEKWRKILSCNRCADYMVARRSAIDRVKRACTLIQQIRMTITGAKAIELESRIRERLDDYTKAIAKIVCNYLNKSLVWDVQFVELLMGKPELYFRICHDYIRFTEKIK